MIARSLSEKPLTAVLANRSQTGFATVIREEVEAFEHVEEEVTESAKRGIEFKKQRRASAKPPPPPASQYSADADLKLGRRLRMFEQR